MSGEWCATTNDDWKVLQGDMSGIATSIGDEIQGIEDHLQNCKRCGCDGCIAHIGYMKVRLGGLCEYIGRLHKEMTEVLSI